MLHRRTVMFIIALLCAFSGIHVARGYYRNYFPPHAGFQHTFNLQNDDTPPGLPLSGKRILRGSTTIAEIDGNTANGKEIAVGGEDGQLYVYHQDGTLHWEVQVVSCSFREGQGLINTAPAVATIDGAIQVVIGYGPIAINTGCAGGISVYNGANGKLTWNYAIPIDPITMGSSVLSSPAVGDVDGNGDVIIASGATDGRLYVLNKNGSLRWRYMALDSIWSSPALADVNGDGRLNIVIGTDFTPGRVCTPTGGTRQETSKGFLYAFSDRPTFQPDPICARDGGTDIYFDKGYLWKVPMDQSIVSSPAIADLDGDGTLEAIVGAGCYYGGTGRWVRIYNAATGELERQLDAPNCVTSSPAIGDVNGDGQLDIVAAVASGGSADPPTQTPSTGGKVMAWSWNGNRLWEVTPLAATAEGADLSEFSNNPIIADIDGNGSHEVLITIQNSVTVLRGTDGSQLTSGCPPANTPDCGPSKAMWMWYPNRTTPAVGNIDNSADGSLEIVSGGSHTSSNNAAFQNRAFLYAWRDTTGLGSPNGPYSPYSAPWPMFRGNPQHTGVFVKPLTPSVVVSPSQIGALISAGRPRSYPLSIANADGSMLNWRVTEDDPYNLVQLNRTSGTSADPLLITIAVPDDIASVEQGIYSAAVTIMASGLPDVTIPITVNVTDQVYDVFLPLTMR